MSSARPDGIETFFDGSGVLWAFDEVSDQWRSIEGGFIIDIFTDGQVSDFQGYASRAQIIARYGVSPVSR